MNIASTRQRLLASTMIASAFALLGVEARAQAIQTAQSAPLPPTPAFGPGAAAALPATGANGAQTTTDEVVVTGSRIKAPGLTSPSPLTVVGSQEFTNIGATQVEQVLNELPSVVADQTAGVSGVSNGTATVDLRDLGAKRTLVLVDGKRLMPGDATSTYNIPPTADLNVIPTQLVDRVEVVTGGASAVYGSDAVAGVVNFVMKKNFQGVQIEATDNFAEHNNDDATARSLIAASGFQEAPAGAQAHNLGEDVNAIFGMNAPDGKGNITGYIGYRHLEPILEGEYDYSACTISAAPGKSTVSTIYAGHACGGSSNGIYGKFVPTLASEALGGTTKQLHANPDGSQSFVTTSVPAYNYGATNYFQRSDTRYTGGYFANYEVSKLFDLYSDFMFSDDSTVAQIAPSGFFAGNGPNGSSTYNINCNNPLLTATQQGQLCGTAAGTATQVPYQIGYRFASFPRDYGYRHTDYKIDIGSRGELADGWTYDAYLQYGTAIVSNLVVNDTSANNLQNALLVDPTTGKCYVGGACVPIDVFKLNGVTQAAFNYVSAPGFQEGQTIEQVASASISGDLGQYGLKSPFADHGVGVAFGAEYRRESLSFSPDEEYQTADLSGTSPAHPNQGTFDVYELFGEVRVPLVQNMPFAKDLEFDGGYRFSDYDTAGITDTYKAQLEYAPSPDVRFRGGYNRAVRAPNVVELFKTPVINGFGGSDPCVGSKPSASLAACVATGLPANLYGNFSNDNNCPAGQCSQLNSGNKNLAPERSDTFTAGIVLTPTMHWARGFTLSVDYFNITVRDLITIINPTVFVQECVAGDTAVCSSTFHRDPTTYVIYGQNGYVTSTETNSGFLRTDGIDVEGSYRKRLSELGFGDFGTVSLNTYISYTNSYVTQPVSGGSTYNCAGLYGLTCLTPLPKIKGKARLTYTPPAFPISVSAQWRYVGPVHLDANTSQPLLTNHAYGITDTADNGLHSFSYFDMNVTWHVRDGLTLNAGCNNILDKNPPIVDSGSFVGSGAIVGNGNTYPGTYDYLGRTLFVTATADF